MIDAIDWRLGRMELRHLRYMAALAECLNFTRAAARVHVTQSTLSHQIRQLEEEVGQTLFERSGKHVVLSEAGEVFLEFAKKALHEVDQGLGAMRQPSGELSGEIRIGTTHTFNLRFIPECVARFLTRHSTARVSVAEMSADDISRRLQDGSLELGIAYRPSGLTQLWFEPLYHEEMGLVVSISHALAPRKRIRMVELHRQKLVLLPASFATRGMLDECFRGCGIEPRVVAEMDTVAPMLGLVAQTDIGAIVAVNAVPEGMGLRVVPIESPTPMRTPGILWRRGVNHSIQVRTFSSIVRKVALSRSIGSTQGRRKVQTA
jgi:LysR family cyn operon transcriptional activator